MTEFEYFIKKGEVKKKEKDEILAFALIKSSEKGEKHIKKQELSEENAEYIVADASDMVRELIEAKLAIDGYKSYSHEATVSYLKKFHEISEQEVIFLDNLRKIRNGIKYYGKEATKEDAEKTIFLINQIILKLKKLVKNAR